MVVFDLDNNKYRTSRTEGSANLASDFLHLGIFVVSTIFIMWWLDFSFILAFFVEGVNSRCLRTRLKLKCE